MVERLPWVALPIRRSDPNSYANTPFMNEIALIEMSRKFSFPNMRMYDGTTDLNNHVAQYKQRMLIVAIQKDLTEATMRKGLVQPWHDLPYNGTLTYLMGPYNHLWLLPTSSWSSSGVKGVLRRHLTISMRSSSIEPSPCATT